MIRIAKLGSLALAAIVLLGSRPATALPETAGPMSVPADGRLGATGGTVHPGELPLVEPRPFAVDPASMDYYRVTSSGLLEYGFRPAPELSPRPLPVSRPAAAVASRFLGDNAELLMIGQDAGDFRLLGSEPACDGSTLVRFEQTWQGIAVESSELRVRVRDEIVTDVEARFVSDTGLLVSCPAPPGVPVDELRFVGQTSGFVVTILVEQLGGSGDIVYVRNLCTGDVIRWTYTLRN